MVIFHGDFMVGLTSNIRNKPPKEVVLNGMQWDPDDTDDTPSGKQTWQFGLDSRLKRTILHLADFLLPQLFMPESCNA